ncbi:hypothetical protein SAMN06297387_106198 [Streptomyces zhaozhouensis]|uniref:Uncharacterized protein n=1 Tax=Streptomyces zhaozhouensis TaxID=1300267 RepID=A0A286DVC1_9ACTN|nr:hypothetical protein [Streptomyces zhaozhouensis]SOD62621.1 hypothetical protein SAMN06297387_106198 [Streptomyces zhaozhouensis]
MRQTGRKARRGHFPAAGPLAGAAAGAAGTSALNAVSYLDMVVRGRGASDTPTESVERLSEVTGVPVPGEGATRENRVAGLGPLLGLATGVGVGAALGLVRPRHTAVAAALATTGALVGSNAPMAALGISDPRRWSAGDWLSDLLPHAAYGLVTAWTLARLSPARRRRTPARR